MAPNVGDDFQEGTKYRRGQQWTPLDWSKRPKTYKIYPSKKKIQLSLQFPEHSIPFVEVLKKRKSIRSYSSKALGINDLSFLLWASTGIQRKQRGYEFRTAPSAGALYPIETYLVVDNVQGLNRGLYHYGIASHALEELGLGSFVEQIAHAALDQEMCLEAPVTFVWTAVFERSKWKYKQRAYRYVYLDAGHIAQNLALSATSIGLGSCQIGAIFDEEINEIIGVDGLEESAIYLSVVGHPRVHV
jgi:SagB-type dehydrogenase family enzyme